MNEPETWQLETRLIGRRVLVYDQLESTNTLALELARDGKNAGTVILAREQTSGRGRYGRSWHCRPGQGVLLSAVVFPPERIRQAVMLTAWAAVAVCETIRRMTDLSPQIKWPNDVLIQGRKVCGILIEQGAATVVGIGLNVNQSAQDLAEAGLGAAGSLALLSGRLLEIDAVARALIEQLDSEYAQMCGDGLTHVEKRWKTLLGCVGREVEIQTPDRTYRGLMTELGWERIEIDLPGTGLVRLRPHSVRQIRTLPSTAWPVEP